MTISRVSVLVQTPNLTVSEITELLRTAPTTGTSVGDPVSPISAPSLVRLHSTWALESSVSDEVDLGPHVVSFEAIFGRLRALSSLNLVVNLSVMAYGSSTGWPLYVGPAVLEYLASVPCGISVDMFNELGWRG